MFIPVLVAVAVAIVFGWLRGGRLANAADLKLRGSVLAALALFLTILPVVAELGDAADRISMIAGFSLVGLFLGVNLRGARGLLRIGLAVLALGWTLNLLVIAANSGMPLSLSAYAASGQDAAPAPGERGFYRIVIAGEGNAPALPR